MSFHTALNDQITDSVSQVNTEVLSDAPTVAMGNLFVATGQALSNTAHNATTNQQQSYATMQASTTQSIGTLLSVNIGSEGIATADVFRSGNRRRYKARPYTPRPYPTTNYS